MAAPRLQQAPAAANFRDTLRTQVGISALRPLRGRPRRRWCAVRAKRTSWGVISLLVALIGLSFPCRLCAKPKFKVLANIPGGLWSGLTFDKAGNLYGVTTGGGEYQDGSIFKMTRGSNGKWAVTILHSFNFKPDGEEPNGDLIFDASGNLYGTTPHGGDYDLGTIFELSPGSNGWNFTVLHAFCEQSRCQDGGGPLAGLAQDKSGSLLGTAGGGLYSMGVVFELTPGASGWTYSILYNFGSHPRDGSDPQDAPVLDAKGNIYGNTRFGGRFGDGTVFELHSTAGGWKERLLLQFDSKDGSIPEGDLVFDPEGNLYGIANGRVNNIFRLTPEVKGRWKETVLYDFHNPEEGFAPATGPVIGNKGTIYGTTALGGTGSCYDGCGVVYKLSPRAGDKWKYTVLHKFMNPDESPPDGRLIMDSKGNLYGTAFGIVYEVTP